MLERPRLVLASGSQARREMLTAAGLMFEVAPADIDETAIRDMLCNGDPAIGGYAVASELARAKAEEISGSRPGAIVIGADQVLMLGSRLFEKPKSLDEARVHLLELRGQTHELISAVSLVADGSVLWSWSECARMAMRPFTPTFLDDYLARAGAGVTASVGCYQLEGLGLQLFERIEGEYFTILGLPLLPLLGELRVRGVIGT